MPVVRIWGSKNGGLGLRFNLIINRKLSAFLGVKRVCVCIGQVLNGFAHKSVV